MNVDLDIGGVIVPITGGERILRSEKREIDILVARKEVTIIHARYAPGEQIAGPHVHHEHNDAFYVLEGELTFEVGLEAETVTVGSGGFVAARPQVAHSFRNDGDRPARWLSERGPEPRSAKTPLLRCGGVRRTASRSMNP